MLASCERIPVRRRQPCSAKEKRERGLPNEPCLGIARSPIGACGLPPAASFTMAIPKSSPWRPSPCPSHRRLSMPRAHGHPSPRSTRLTYLRTLVWLARLTSPLQGHSRAHCRVAWSAPNLSWPRSSLASSRLRLDCHGFPIVRAPR